MAALLAIGLIASLSLLSAGEETITPLREALRKLVEKADSGDAKALYDLAMLHDRGYDSIPVDTLRSTMLYTLSAEKGYAPARNYLGFRYYRGEGVERDVTKGLEWIEKAAMQGDPKAANNLGWLLLEGEGVVHDDAKAAFWFERAADAGLPAGQAQLADMLRIGRGVPADTLRADSLYCRAIEAGLQDAEAKLLAMQRERWRTLSSSEALALGLRHYTHRAPTIGVTLFEQVAAPVLTGNIPQDSTSKSTSAHALALLGDAHTRALGTGYDYDLSTLYFTEAALLGDPSAQFIVGELLEIFPDALDNLPITDSILRSASPTAGESCLEKSPVYWFERADENGITDAAQANQRLLTP